MSTPKRRFRLAALPDGGEAANWNTSVSDFDRRLGVSLPFEGHGWAIADVPMPEAEEGPLTPRTEADERFRWFAHQAVETVKNETEGSAPE